MDGPTHGIARWLLPPTERSGAFTSLRNPLVDPWRSLAQCLCLLPKAVVRQARRNTTTPTFLLESFIVCYAFTAGAFWSNPPSLVNDPWGLLRMAIPASAASLGLLLRNAYSAAQESPSPWPRAEAPTRAPPMDSMVVLRLVDFRDHPRVIWIPCVCLSDSSARFAGIDRSSS